MKRKKQKRLLCRLCLKRPCVTILPLFKNRAWAPACDSCIKGLHKQGESAIKVLEDMLREYIVEEPAFYHPETDEKSSAAQGQ